MPIYCHHATLLLVVTVTKDSMPTARYGGKTTTTHSSDGGGAVCRQHERLFTGNAPSARGECMMVPGVSGYGVIRNRYLFLGWHQCCCEGFGRLGGSVNKQHHYIMGRIVIVGLYPVIVVLWLTFCSPAAAWLSRASQRSKCLVGILLQVRRRSSRQAGSFPPPLRPMYPVFLRTVCSTSKTKSMLS